jgi:hypothetical protein
MTSIPNFKRSGPMFTAIATLLCTAMVLAAGAARADDRPFLQTSNAVSEDDDEGAWALESWWASVGGYSVFNIAPEYAFTPYTNLQFKAFKSRDSDSGERSRGVETEFKHLFNNTGRDGFGWGMHLSLAQGRDTGSGSGTGWREQSFAAKLIATVPLFEGDAKLHANGGLSKLRDERREWIGSVAFEHKLPWRTTAFVEVGREDRQTLLHTGVRHWIKREKLAVDFSVQQQRSGSGKESGVVFGVGWYDL